MSEEQEWGRIRAWIYSLINRNPASNRDLVELAHLSEVDRTLDVGCGPGSAVRQAAPTVREAVGVDRSEAMIGIARRRSTGLPNVRFEVSSAEALPFPDGSFTVVWTIHAFHHWADQQAGIAEARRVLAPGGRLLILERDTAQEHGLSPEEAEALRDRLAAEGFEEVSVTPHRQDVMVAAVKPGVEAGQSP